MNVNNWSTEAQCAAFAVVLGVIVGHTPWPLLAISEVVGGVYGLAVYAANRTQTRMYAVLRSEGTYPATDREHLYVKPEADVSI